jgi:hypothetical protein
MDTGLGKEKSAEAAPDADFIDNSGWRRDSVTSNSPERHANRA